MMLIRALMLAYLCWATGTAHAQTRVALVIGNGAYEFADKLANPTVDSRAMRDALTKLGFKVVYGENLAKQEMERTIGRFAVAARESDVAITYYAGHGATFGGTPYMVPVNAQFSDIDSMPYELVPLENMVSELRRAKGIRIAIVDACRDNSKEAALKRIATRGGETSRGLTRVSAPDGLVVAYSTQYNTTAADGAAGSNSPFTAALLQKLPTPGLDIKDLFFRTSAQVIRDTDGRQRPEIAVSLYEDFALVPKIVPASTLTPLPSVESEPIRSAAQTVDGAFLDMIASLTDRDVLTRLKENSSAAVRDAAKARLAALPTSFAQTPPTPLVVDRPKSEIDLPTRAMRPKLLCSRALGSADTAWDTDPKFAGFVAEAISRGLSVDGCRLAIGLFPYGKPAREQASLTFEKANTDELCGYALNLDGNSWESSGYFEPASNFAKFRKDLTIDDCRKALGVKTLRELAMPRIGQLDDLSICKEALGDFSYHWNSDPDHTAYVTEARERNLSVDRCRSSVEAAKKSKQGVNSQRGRRTN